MMEEGRKKAKKGGAVAAVVGPREEGVYYLVYMCRCRSEQREREKRDFPSVRSFIDLDARARAPRAHGGPPLRSSLHTGISRSLYR